MKAPENGILLVADPFLKDPNFMRSVVLICKHENKEGTFGFTLSRLLEQTLDEFIPGFEEFPLQVFMGGPVQVDTIHYLHQYPDLIPGCHEIADGIFWGGDFELLKQFIKSGDIKPDKIKFFLGYSGWDAGQLESELTENSWLTVMCNRKIVFDTPIDEVWKSGVRLMGEKYTMMINFPIDPQLN